MSDEKPLISVCTITYNHAPYIEQAMRSVLAQKHNYRIEFVIGDDFSTDNTREIIQRVRDEYPDIVVCLFREKNIGAKANQIQCLKRCTGKYIAFLEGDDYWSDPYKLEKQVTFMEANPDFALCFTHVDTIDDTGHNSPNPFTPLTRDVYTIEDVILAERVFIPTPTIFFKNVFADPLPDFFGKAISGDIAIHLVVSDKGKIKYLPEKTAVYRQHAGGITKTKYVIDNAYRSLFNMYVGANEHYAGKYDAIFKKRLAVMSKTLLIYYSTEKKGLEKLKHVVNNTYNYLKYSPRINMKEIVYYFIVLFFPSLLKLKKSN